MLSEKTEKLAEEPKSRGMWLYDPTYKRWYSPENFKHVFSYADAKDEFLDKIEIRHPEDGIHAGFKKLEDIQSKLAMFSKSVLDYYRKK